MNGLKGNVGGGEVKYSSAQGTFSASNAPVPGVKGCSELYSPLPLRICFKADLYPKEYLPDLTTRARREAIDSVDFAALDFLVGAITNEGCFFRRVKGG